MWNWAKDLPTTNVRIFVSIVLAVLLVLTLLVMLVLGRDIKVDAALTIAGFIFSMMGLDVAQYVQKRKTHIPNTVAPEDRATAETPVPAK